MNLLGPINYIAAHSNAQDREPSHVLRLRMRTKEIWNLHMPFLHIYIYILYI